MDTKENTLWIESEAQLRAHLPMPATMILQKKQPTLEKTGMAWLSKSGFVGVALHQEKHPKIQLYARRSGVSSILDESHVALETQKSLNTPDFLTEPSAIGALFMVPGISNTMRMNGVMHVDASQRPILSIQETYMHCPKAFIRSKLWTQRSQTAFNWIEEKGTSLGANSQAFIQQSPFAFLATASDEGHVDLSPRGDPAGFIRIVDEKTLLLPDRPGNRIADSFRNILSHPFVTLLLMIPGCNWVLQILGKAKITADPQQLQPSTIKGKCPLLGIILEIETSELYVSPALHSTDIWDTTHHIHPKQLPTLGETLVKQIEPTGKLLGLKSKIVDWSIRRDSKKNLY